MWIFTQYVIGLMVSAMSQCLGSSGSCGPFASVWVGLLVSPTPPLTDVTNLGVVTEASYSGYARQKVSWYPAFFSAAGPLLLEGHSLKFSPTDALNPQVITGVMLCDAATGGTYLCGYLASPENYPLTDPLSALIVDAEISLPVTANYGGPYLSN